MTYKTLILGVSTLMLAGCASAVMGGSQKVDVIVKGSPTAYCEFYNEKYRNAGHFPNTVTLERAREPLTADCTGEQGRRIKFKIMPVANEEGTVGNVPTAIVPGVAYDAMTGAMWSYPDPIIVDFRTVGEGPKPEWPADETSKMLDRKAFLNHLRDENAVGMQPVLDMDPSVPKREVAAPVVIDAVTLAVDKKAMAPVISPEDHMGLHPAEVKAKAEAKRKAEQEAKAKAAAEKQAKAAAAKAEKEAKSTEAAASKAAASAATAQTESEAAATMEPAAMSTPVDASRFDAPVPEVQDSLLENATDIPPVVIPQTTITLEQPLADTPPAPSAELAAEMEEAAQEEPALAPPEQSGPEGYGLQLDDGATAPAGQ